MTSPYDWSYGFDFEANDCQILDSDYETVRKGTLALATVEPDFHALGQPGALAPKLGLLAQLSRYRAQTGCRTPAPRRHLESEFTSYSASRVVLPPTVVHPGTATSGVRRRDTDTM
ncbi:hypothetical protein [Streptomyces sp. NPDC096132]|uniref:hypothetical protein n=1 Tax=Streptomyces sp. NPDC096132 TaxID=3366075 RepID=UPI00380EA67E